MDLLLLTVDPQPESVLPSLALLESRPDRAVPRWTRDRQACRQYWSGGGWTC